MSGQRKEGKKRTKKVTIRPSIEMVEWVEHQVEEEKRWASNAHAYVWAMAQVMKKEGYKFSKEEDKEFEDSGKPRN